MKTTLNILKYVSCIAFLPTIILYSSNYITTLLEILNICSSYDGNGFGSSSICNIFPTISYFGYIILILSGLIIAPTIIGVASFLAYNIIYLINSRKYPETIIKYALSMKILFILLVLLSFSISTIIWPISLAYVIFVLIYKNKYANSKYNYGWVAPALIVLMPIFQFNSLILYYKFYRETGYLSEINYINSKDYKSNINIENLIPNISK